jgi:hypothetical protein
VPLRRAGVFLLLALSLLTPPAAAQETQPWRVEEVRLAVGPGLQRDPGIAGDWVAWVEQADYAAAQGVRARNLRTGQEVALPPRGLTLDPVLAGGTLVLGEGQELVGYRLPGLERFVVAPVPARARAGRQALSALGDRVAWVEGESVRLSLLAPVDVMLHDLASGQTRRVSGTGAAWPLEVALSERLVAWPDGRHGVQGRWDVYALDLATGQERRVTANSEAIGGLAATGTTVVWSTMRDGIPRVLALDTATGQESEVARLDPCSGPPRLAADGDVVVWGARALDAPPPCMSAYTDVYAHDLRAGRTLVVSRAIGPQDGPRVSGRRVVWTDRRNSSTGGIQGYDADVFGALLEPTPGPLPPRTGAPAAADARIQIVWPHGPGTGHDAARPVAEAPLANLDLWLFEPGSPRPSPCQWAPPVRLWRAVDNEPAAPVGFASIEGNRFEAHGRRLPSWYVNDLDVAPARDPGRRVYFFATVEGVASRTNVWAHAADARTRFPAQDVPTGVGGPTAGPLDAKIEIVWPHGGASVERAERANVTAALFAAGTLQAVPPEHGATVRLWRSLNQGVGEEVGVGRKRLVAQGALTYPVWDFDDVDVAAARDPANKYFFRLSVDGADVRSNVWAHGADGRSHFPRPEEPTAACSVPG